MNGPDEMGDRIRVEELRNHGVTIGSRFNAWHATVPQENGERVVVRYSLPTLLDDVDAILAGDDPMADTG